MKHGRMTRRDFLARVGVTAGAVALGGLTRAIGAADTAPASSPTTGAARPPNIIFILTDDVGLPDIGCCGSDRFKTPRIDALAAAGTRFERCFAMPLCGPSRCMLLTGRYPFRTGMIGNNSGGKIKPANEVMVPRMLKPAGYVTAQVGKWAQLPLQPSAFGFDEYLRFQASGVYWRDDKKKDTYTVNGKTQEIPEGKYMPDMMHDFLVDFITRHKDRPFYVYYSMSHMHSKLVRTPDSAGGAEGGPAIYADNIAYMDKLVGKLVDELDKLKLRERTIIIFTGDNGSAGVGANTTVGGKKISGRKGTMLEGGSRVPLVVCWPGMTPAGKVSKDLIDFSDFYPTLAELAGAELPKGVTIDGRSFAPQLKGLAGKPREWVYVELEGKRYVRSDRWKLTGDGEFFDMKEAPYKEIPVAADTTDADATAERKRLKEVLAGLVEKAGAKS
ncbi:MAG: sulfatase-like hydrolase/transferase [Phycisphaerae bacterium]